MSKSQDKGRNPGYELSDAKLRPVLWAGAGLFLLVLIGFTAIYFLFGLLGSQHADDLATTSPLALERQLPTGPRLQVDPGLELQLFQASQDSLLTNYGWVQRNAGIVRIPIAEAMEKMLKIGFPVREDHEQN